MSNQAGKLDLNWVQTTGSALAALSSAVLLSTLGAAGTLVGAAVGSIVVTVGGTVYSHYLSVSRARMSAARSAALVRASRVRTRSASTSADGSVAAVTRTIAASPERFPLLSASATGTTTMPSTAAAGTAVPVAASPGPPGRRLIDGNLPGESTSLRQLLRGTRWKPALAASLGVFVLAMGAIVSMEMATGRALSSFTGGSSADGPRTSFALLGSTSDADGGHSTTTDPADSDKGAGGSGDTASNESGAQSTGGSGGGSSTSSGSDTDAPQPDTSTSDPDAGTPTQPAPEPTPDTPTEPAPAPTPTPAPSTQAPAKAPAPTTGAAVSDAAAQSVS